MNQIQRAKLEEVVAILRAHFPIALVVGLTSDSAFGGFQASTLPLPFRPDLVADALSMLRQKMPRDPSPAPVP